MYLELGSPARPHDTDYASAALAFVRKELKRRDLKAKKRVKRPVGARTRLSVAHAPLA
jgi:hypothetical protein